MYIYVYVYMYIYYMYVYVYIYTKILRGGSTQKNVKKSGFWGNVRMDSG